MGSILSTPLKDSPRKNIISSLIIILILQQYLKKRIEKRHTTTTTTTTKKKTTTTDIKRNLSFKSLQRIERLGRAVQLNRSTPKNLKCLLLSFFDCHVAIAILDVLIAQKFNARYFALHTLVNSIVTIGSTRDLIKAFSDPKNSMEGPCNVTPVYMILSLFIYHVLFFKNVPYDEWWHHILFGVGIGGIGLHYCPGPLQNALAFFISGFPGGVDYGMLALVKQGLLKAKTEKFVNGFMNAWVRGPGLTVTGFCVYVASKYGRTSMPSLAAATIALLSVFNGNYYSARVVASAGASNWRPS